MGVSSAISSQLSAFSFPTGGANIGVVGDDQQSAVSFQLADEARQHTFHVYRVLVQVFVFIETQVMKIP
jgi:hypothetical protein